LFLFFHAKHICHKLAGFVWIVCDQKVMSSIPSRARQVVCNPCASFTKQYNLVAANKRSCSVAGKVTVGLALHWPSTTGFSCLSHYRLKACEREMSTPPRHLCFFAYRLHATRRKVNVPCIWSETCQKRTTVQCYETN